MDFPFIEKPNVSHHCLYINLVWISFGLNTYIKLHSINHHNSVLFKLDKLLINADYSQFVLSRLYKVLNLNIFDCNII